MSRLDLEDFGEVGEVADVTEAVECFDDLANVLRRAVVVQARRDDLAHAEDSGFRE